MSTRSQFVNRSALRLALPLATGGLLVAASTTAFAFPEHQPPAASAVKIRRDSMKVTIEPAKRIEVKLVMTKGQKADFEWSTDGAEVLPVIVAIASSRPATRFSRHTGAPLPARSSR